MLDVKQATKVFSAGTASEHHALNGLDLHPDDGEFVTIIGSNGAGKSTLLMRSAAITGWIRGQDFPGWSGYHFSVGAPQARQIGRVFRDPMKGTALHRRLRKIWRWHIPGRIGSHFEVRSANRKRIYSGQSLRSTIWIWKTV